ncbi:uncharacterized protein LOC18442394 isoform X1 [Amborella trichopoda]|uniref:uncharacterized protein LOC18442394 isoform X1 n=1 Tax=Amborella trichopoda TaxID=13333 RepID=UPI0009BE1250|nr:uncharacterized protein LOC18442394 isoform X1 [Amborella trichopoda]|eukprot:XP_011626325.2 uncharacterized protein LOC18442394 isoform X1 [Amborella trichopoda]
MLSFLRCHKLSSSPPSRQRRGAGEFRERKRGREMAGEHLMKRIPRIKFPQRHSKSPGSGSSQKTDVPPHEMAQDAKLSSQFNVSLPPSNTSVGGKASLQPKRTSLSEKEIEAIMLGGCF